MASIESVLESFMLDCQSRRLTPKTIKWYREMLTKFVERFPGTDIAGITTTHIRLWMVELQDAGYSGATQHAYVRCLRVMMNFATGEELIVKNPMSKIKMPKQDKTILPAFTKEEVSTIMDACESHRDRAIFLFLLDTGLRVNECSNLRIEDIDMTLREVTVKQGKGRKDRTTYFGESTKKYLIRHLTDSDSLQVTEGPLWKSRSSGEALQLEGIQFILRQLKLKTGILKCSPHTCRRTFAIWNLRAGMNIFELARIMGHSDIKVLQRYLDVLNEDTKAAHKKAGAVDSFMNGD